jgi:hypothetical protein
MSTQDQVSYFSKFLLKFVEIIAAGLATAVSGYVIAHLTGALSSPAPAPAPAPTAAVIQVAPSVIAPSDSPAQPPSPVSAGASDQHLAPQQDNNAPPAAQSTRKTAKSESSRKHIENAPNAAASARDEDSFVSRVRAALASANANRIGPTDVSSRQSASRVPAATAQPKTDLPAGVVLAAPPAPERAPAVQELPTDANPLATVETTSRPIAETQLPPEPPAAKETGVLSTLEQMLRQDPLAGTEQPPRPPMPVGH